jgi:hypothetical protein
LKRFAKLYGSRVSLDDIEAFLESRFPISVIAKEAESKLLICYSLSECVEESDIRSTIAHHLAVPTDTFVMKIMEMIPITSSGKKDYQCPLL